MKKEKGITLIALVITIIILLILAGIAISSLTGNGLLAKAKLAKEKYEIAEVKEKVNMLISEYLMSAQKGMTLSEFLTEKKESGEIDDFIDNNNGTFEIIINGYTVTINEDDLSVSEPELISDVNIKVEAKGFKDNNIEAVITVTSTKGGIKQIKLLDNIIAQGNNKNVVNFEYTIEANKEYTIDIELANGKNIQKPIKYEDTEAPTAEIEIPTKVFFNSGTITANVEIKDNKSGVNISNCKWTLSDKNTKIGTDEELYTGGEFENTKQKIEIDVQTITNPGEYYIHLLLKDNIGNLNEVISEKVEIKQGYQISSPQELQAISSNLGATYYVTQDIDMTGFDFQIIKNFIGTLDGQGHTISNFTTTTGGMFENMHTGKASNIKNVLFKNVNISGHYNQGTGIVSTGSCHFEKVGVTGSMNFDGGGYLGALLGYGYGSDPSSYQNCYARVNVKTPSYYYPGGLYGFHENNTVVNKCYFAGNVSGFRNTGKVTNCFYDSDKRNASGSEIFTSAGTALKTSEFIDQTKFTGWDFTNDWYIDTVTGYPELKFSEE